MEIGLRSEVQERPAISGCGLVVPELLEGVTILDLGCGAGRDVYVLSQLVVKRGR